MSNANWPAQGYEGHHHAATGMYHPHPHQTLQARPQPFRPLYTQGIVHRWPPHPRGMMGNTPPHSSFFTDEMYYLRDESALYEEPLWQQSSQPSTATSFAFRPLLSSAHPSSGFTAAATHVAKVESSPPLLPLQVPGVLSGEVNARKYSIISDDDWARASIDYEAPSPASVSSDTDLPATPGMEYGSSRGGGLFAEEFSIDQKFATAATVAPNLIQEQPLPTFASPSQYNATLFPLHHMYGQYPVADALAHSNMMASRNFTIPSYTGVQTAAPDVHYTVNDADLRISPEPTNTEGTPSDCGSPVDDGPGSFNSGNNHLEQRDRFIVEMRARGMSYKKIRSLGGFVEAESTLRGRYRMLKKPKEERVRRPKWEAYDIELLERAVDEFTPPNSRVGVKLPWKQIAKWMMRRGASYPFGAGTVSKKWRDLSR